MKVSMLKLLRREVAAARCPDCRHHRLEIQDIRGDIVSVLCSSCGWFTEDWGRP